MMQASCEWCRPLTVVPSQASHPARFFPALRRLVLGLVSQGAPCKQALELYAALHVCASP